MAEEKLLTVRDVSIMLGISEKEVVDLAESANLPAYKIGGVFLRFKKEQVQEFKRKAGPQLSHGRPEQKYTFKDRVSDFFHFNDFYILSLLIILLLLFIIMQGF